MIKKSTYEMYAHRFDRSDRECLLLCAFARSASGCWRPLTLRRTADAIIDLAVSYRFSFIACGFSDRTTASRNVPAIARMSSSAAHFGSKRADRAR
jgi:hypothetical protein